MTRIIIIRQRGMDAEKPARVTAWRKNRVFKRDIDRHRIIDNSADKNTEKICMALAQGRRLLPAELISPRAAALARASGIGAPVRCHEL